MKNMLIKKSFIILAALVCLTVVFALLASCQTIRSVNRFVGITRVMHNANPDSQTAYKVPEGWTRYEGEDAQLFGTAVAGIGDEHLYSNGNGVKNFVNSIGADYFPEDWTGMNYVRFTVRVPEDGNYFVDIITNGPDDKVIMTKVNEGFNQAHTVEFFPNMGGGNGPTQWNSIFAIKLLLGNFKAGVDNYIYIAGANIVEDIYDSPWMNIDCIDVKNTPEN